MDTTTDTIAMQGSEPVHFRDFTFSSSNQFLTTITLSGRGRIIRKRWSLGANAYCSPNFSEANPLAAILAMQMMLEWLGTRHADRRLHRAAEQVEAAVAELLREGKTLTYDLIGEAKASRCSEVGAAVEEKLRNMT